MNWSSVGEALLGQLGALVAFFAFPAVQYIFLRRLARGEGKPELWHLPQYGFRLVIRNLPRRRTLSNIKYRALIRTVVPANEGSSVATWQDHILVQREDFFLFPGSDQVLVCFRLERDPLASLVFVYTDKLGTELGRLPVDDKTVLVADFTGTLENLFNFDIAIGRRAEVNGKRLSEIAAALAADADEQCFEVSRVREVG